MDYIALIHTLVDPIVNKPESLLIRELPSEDEKRVTFLICAENSDCARLIGKKGCVANALRDIINIAGKLDHKRVGLKFESFEETKEEK